LTVQDEQDRDGIRSFTGISPLMPLKNKERREPGGTSVGQQQEQEENRRRGGVAAGSPAEKFHAILAQLLPLLFLQEVSLENQAASVVPAHSSPGLG